MMKVPPLSLVGMERLPLPLPFSPELLWRYNTLAPPHSNGGHPPSSAHSNAVNAAISRAAAAAAAAAASNIPSPLATQLPFAYDIKHTIPLNLANDPRLWNREDVMTFLQWCEREFDLPSFDSDRFQMNGKALCLLTKADLESRAPCSGDVIHNALQILSSSAPPAESPLTPHTPSSLRMLPLSWKGACSIADLQQFAASQGQGTTSVTLSPAPSLDGQAGSPQEAANPGASSSSSSSNGGLHSDDSEYDGESPERSPANQSSLSPPPQPPSSRPASAALPPQLKSTPPPKSFSSPAGPPKLNTPAEGSEYNNNGRLLWDFLQQLLNDPSQRYSSFITWKNVETGIFKIVDPPGLARLWGIQKNHLSMNYDKMSRALRYYYRVNILRKVQGERHCYQFLRNPGELKSIKNISMLRHQQSKPEAPPPQYEVEYENLSMLRPTQTSPVSLTTKTEGGFCGEEYHESVSMLRPTQTSPVSLTTKTEGDFHFRVRSPKKEEDYEGMMMTQNSPMSLTRNDRAELLCGGGGGGGGRVKVEEVEELEEEEEEEEDYEDTQPTDLSMDTERHSCSLKEDRSNENK